MFEKPRELFSPEYIGTMKYTKRPSTAPKKKRMMKRKPRMASVAKLSKVVKKLQSMNDGEKKRITTFFQDTVGQVNANADGAIVLDVTPLPTSGSNSNQRTGASFRLHSTNYQFNVIQQANTKASIKMKLTWLQVNGAPYSSGTLISQFFTNVYNPNPFIGPTSVRDINAQYNPDYFGTYKVLRTVHRTVAPDQLSDVATNHAFRIGMRYNNGKGHDVRFNANGNGVDNLFNGQIVLVIQLDRGNESTVISTLSGNYDSSATSGLFVQYNKTDYYYDN